MSSGGFNVIIGNPPYIGAETMTSLMLKEREYCQRQYISAKGNWNIYMCFIDKSMNLLKKGLMSYITPDKWITKPFGDGIREHYIEKISQIVNAGRRVFQDAKIDSIITIFNNETTKIIDVKVYNEKSTFFQVNEMWKKSLLNHHIN